MLESQIKYVNLRRLTVMNLHNEYNFYIIR